MDKQVVLKTMVSEHLSLGPRKCVSYLPLRTISEHLNMTVQSYADLANSRGLRSVVVDPDQSCIQSGAVYVFSDSHLTSLLQRFRTELDECDWPTDSAGFVHALSKEWLDQEHPVMKIVRKAFGEKR